jgi:hypothetical protein
VTTGEIESCLFVAPREIAAARGSEAALRHLEQVATEQRPNVVLVMAPWGHEHEREWVRHLLALAGEPVVLCWDGDAWGRFTKPLRPSARVWLAESRTVFSVALGPQEKLLRRAGARCVRYIPNTYCHVKLREAEDVEADSPSIVYDTVLIGTRLAHWGLVSRMPGAVARARLVARLQRSNLKIAVYGEGWTGRGAMGVLPWHEQVVALRQGLTSVNWDHFPTYEGYASNRLAVSLLAARPHVTTAHSGMEWLPGERIGLFMERTTRDARRRVEELVARPQSELLALGAAAHAWTRDRISHRQGARYMLAEIDRSFLDRIPDDPWHRLAASW